MSTNNFSQIGYDYGIKPNLMLIADIEYSNLFKEANCNGLLYMSREGVNKEMIPVEISFIFDNEKPAEKLFDILLSWVEKSNGEGDAVTIDFIENNIGGYTLSIHPEPHRFIDRMLPKELKDRVTPLMMILTHYKEIDSLGQNYLNFKLNHKKSKEIIISYVVGTPINFKKSKRSFSKKNFQFFKENEIPQHSMALGYTAKEKFNSENLSKPPKPSLQEIEERRKSEMKSLLPLTYSKLNNLWLGKLQNKLCMHYDLEIIKQAICNLTVLERLKQQPNLTIDLNHKNSSLKILEYLLATYESFDSYYPEDNLYTEESVLRQIENDKKELETFLK